MRWQRFALLIVSLLLSVAVAEVVVRSVEQPSLRRTVAASRDTIDLQRLNYNDTEVRRRRAPEEVRILSLGDSFAFGVVQPPYTYHRVAAERLDRMLAPRRFRLVNLGEPAVSFPEYLRALRFWEREIEHDGVLVNVYLGNDVVAVAVGFIPWLGDVNGYFASLPFAIRDGTPRVGEIPRAFPLRLADYAYAVWLLHTAGVANEPPDPRYNHAYSPMPEDAYLSYMNDELDDFDPARLEAMRPGYASLAELLRELSARRAQGKKVGIVLSPSRTQVDLAFHAALRPRAGDRIDRLDLTLPGRVATEMARLVDPGIAVIDLLPGFQCAAVAKEALYVAPDAHWSVAGNALAGELVALGIARSWFDHGDLPPQDGWLRGCAPFGPAPHPGAALDDGAVRRFAESVVAAAPAQAG